ncbi:MAG: zinc ribbon domain-containing protein [Candidatus Bipolaricaulota bacterium]|nr:zinc ribbon domain-containing protein [Candidatus Bipolaricaulota bacterium]MDW8127299.1 zinc ribbon domain-containing protein [Candidatus Bipolaricaulota bacterium]
MSKFCESCGAPLSSPEMQGPSSKYCKYCTDAAGKLKPRAEVQRGIAEWLKTWQPGITQEQAIKRADHYMKAMPAWAED